MRTPDQFVAEYDGKNIDWDGVYGTQCVDGFKVFCAWAGIPVRATPNGWADSIFTGLNADKTPNQSYIAWRDTYFEQITDRTRIQNGDWCVWGKGFGSYPLSHVAMYYNGQYFGENQGGDRGFRLVPLNNDIIGALRWKGWSNTGKYTIQPGRQDLTFEEKRIIVYGQRPGQRLGMISASGPDPMYALQPIGSIDSDQAVIYASMNCNYFQMSTKAPDAYGCHYGTEISFTNDFSPHQGNLLAYALMNDGKTFAAIDSEFWYTRNEVQFACAPAYLAYLRGNKVGLWSYAFMQSKTRPNTQSLLIRTADRFAFAVIRDAISIDDAVRWAEGIDGLMDLAFFDSGGSSQLMLGYDVVVNTGREIPNVLAFYIPKDGSDPVTPADPEPGTDPEPEPLEAEVLRLQKENKELREKLEQIRILATI